jgi:hypothetical protein
MSWVAVAIAGSAVVSGVVSSNASKSAANAQAQAAQQSNDTQLQMYNQTRSDQAPWRDAGQGALNRLTSASTGDNSNFFASPDYNFTRSEGLRGLQQTAAARGTLGSGNALKALAQFNQGLASQQYGDWWNRQAGLAGVGQNATNATQQAGQAASSNISNGLMAGGDARASGIMGAANGWNNSLNSGLNNYLLYQGGYFNKPVK